MRVNQDFLYVVYRNGKPFRYLASKQQGLFYLAACLDLDPASSWLLCTKEVSGDA